MALLIEPSNLTALVFALPHFEQVSSRCHFYVAMLEVESGIDGEACGA
jgi:hypothetical protein